MPNAYYEVARTYWRRPLTSWIQTLFTLLFLILLLASIASPALLYGGQTMAISWALAVIGIMLWSHLREQATCDARHLLPGFVAPHVTVFAGFILLIVVGFPAAMICFGAPVSVGVMAYTGVWMAVIGWWVLTLSTPLFFAAFAGWLWIQTDNGHKLLRLLFRGQNEAVAALILACSLCAIAIAIYKLFWLAEEDPLYHRRLQFNGSSLRPRMTGEVNRAWMNAQQNSLFGLRQSQSVFVPTGPGLWARAKRWRMLTRTNSWAVFFMAILMVASARIGSWGHSATPMLLLFLIWMPATMSVGAWQQLWRFLEADSLRPIARADLIKEIGLAILLDGIRAWASFASIVAADALIFQAKPAAVLQVLTWLWLSLLLQIPAFGIAVFQMRYRSPAKLMLGSIGGMILPGFLLILSADQESPLASQRMLVGLVVFSLAIGGLFIIRNAYRKWLVTELG